MSPVLEALAVLLKEKHDAALAAECDRQNRLGVYDPDALKAATAPYTVESLQTTLTAAAA